MKPPRSTIFALLTVTVLVLGGCGGGDETGRTTAAGDERSPTPNAAADAADTPTTPAAETPAPKPGTAVKAADSQYGDVLFDRGGQAVYFFDKERSVKPECYGACAEAWPPVLTDGAPTASGSVRPSLLGTTSRTDGTTQVTYDGRPLYYYAHEGKDVVLCHNVDEFGGLWLAVTPSGRPAPH